MFTSGKGALGRLVDGICGKAVAAVSAHIGLSATGHRNKLALAELLNHKVDVRFPGELAIPVDQHCSG